MGFRLKTSKETEEIFEELGRKTNLKPYTLSKIAISLSIKENRNIDDYENEDTLGLELNRQTILGEYDIIYKSLMEQNLNRALSDDEFYPYYSKKHLDRGAKILKSKINYYGNFEGFFMSIIKGSEAI